MAVILAYPGDPSLVDYQHYVWANMFHFLGAHVAIIPLKSVCSTALVMLLKQFVTLYPVFLHLGFNSKTSCYRVMQD